MIKNRKHILLGLFLLLLNIRVFADSQHLLYCYDCNGNLTLYLSHYHGNNESTTLDYTITVNGVTTTYTNRAPNATVATHGGVAGSTVGSNGTLDNISYTNLPRCEGTRTTVMNCQEEQDWIVFYHPNMPRGVPITVQFLSGNNAVSELDECNPNGNGMRRKFTFYIPINPIASSSGNYCINQTPPPLSVRTTQFTNTVYEYSGALFSSTPTDTTHTVQWQVADSPTGPWSNVTGPGNAQTYQLAPLVVLGIKYYQAIYMSSSTSVFVPGYWEDVNEVRCPNCSSTGGDTILVPAGTRWVPDATVLTSAGGCPLTSNVISVGTYVGPTAKAGTDTTLCRTAAVLKQMGTTPTAGWNYTWSPTTGLDNPNIANPTASLNTPGTYTYVVTTQNPSCPITIRDTAIIKVNPLPTATISGATAVCQGDAAPNITFTGANATPPYTFTYTLNGGGNLTVSTTGGSSSVTVSIPTGTSGTNTYSLVSVLESSTTACSQAQTGTAVVTVNPLPTATISGTANIVLNDPPPNVTFTGANGTAPYTFTYTINGGANQTVSTTAGNSVTLSQPTNVAGTFTYSLVSVQDASSGTCSQNQTGSAVVNISSFAANIAGSVNVCQSVTQPILTLTGAGGVAPYTFTYSINGGANQTISTVGASSTTTVSVPTGTTGTFVYSISNLQDANALSSASVSSATVTVSPIPTATIGGATTLCENTPAPDITFTGASGTAPYTFTYTLNGGANQTISTTAGNSVTLSVPTSTAGTFTYDLVSVQDSGPSACSQAQTGTAVVTIDPTPTATIGGTADVCNGTPAPNITFTGSSGTPPYTFTYTINGGTSQTISTVGASSTVTVAAPTGTSGAFIYALTGVQDANLNACGTASGNATVTVNPLPTATISGTTTICQNVPNPDITFTGANGTPPYTFTYTLDGGANQTISTTSGNSVTLSVPTSTSGTFTYDLVSVQDASSTTCSQAQTGSAVVTINPAPSAAITGDIDVCSGDPSPNITFTGSAGVAPYTFTYNVNGGANQTVSTTGGSSIVTIAAPTGTSGMFTYALTAVQDANLSTCGFASGSVMIMVNPLPTASIIGTTSVCQNSPSPNIVFTGITGTSPFTFTYTINGGANQTISTIAGTGTATIPVTTTTAGIFTYDLVSVQDASSTACVNTASGSAVVTINPAPTAAISGTTAVCNGAPSPNITFTGSGGAPPYIFTYNINGGASQTATTTGGSSSVTVPAPTTTSGVFTYSLTGVQDANLSACGFASGGVVVTVNPLPTATISGATAVCEGSAPQNITFTAAGFSPPYTFTYTINGGANQTISTTGGNSVNVSVPTSTVGSFTYDLVSVQDAGTPACSQAQTGSAVVTINPLPVVTVNSTSICPGASTTLTASGANSYVWSNGSTLPSTTISPTSTTPYTVTGTSSFGCISSGSGNVNVSPIPVAQFRASPNPALMLSPQVTFINMSSPDINYWSWNFGDGDSSNSSNPVHMYPSDTAIYTVTLVVHNSGFCYDTISHIVKVDPEFGFYIPNAFSPDEDKINDVFFCKGESILEFSMSIYDRWGNFIFYSDDINEGWDGKANSGSETAQRDVYVYSIKVIDFKKKVHNYRGTITLVK